MSPESLTNAHCCVPFKVSLLVRCSPKNFICTISLRHACMLSCFSPVQLFATPWTVARQASLSMGFSSKESWNGWTLPPPGDLPDPGIKPSSLTTPALEGGFFITSAISLNLLIKQWEPWFAEEQTERWSNSIKGQAGWRRSPESTPECVPVLTPPPCLRLLAVGLDRCSFYSVEPTPWLV